MAHRIYIYYKRLSCRHISALHGCRPKYVCYNIVIFSFRNSFSKLVVKPHITTDSLKSTGQH